VQLSRVSVLCGVDEIVDGFSVAVRDGFPDSPMITSFAAPRDRQSRASTEWKGLRAFGLTSSETQAIGRSLAVSTGLLAADAPGGDLTHVLRSSTSAFELANAITSVMGDDGVRRACADFVIAIVGVLTGKRGAATTLED
jgi:hypothetical protein